MCVERLYEAETHKPAEQPSTHVKQLDLMAGDELQITQVRIALGEEIQIGNVAIAEQTQPELGIANRMDALPAEYTLSPARREDRERLADVTKNCRGGRKTAIGRLRRGDPVGCAPKLGKVVLV